VAIEVVARQQGTVLERAGDGVFATFPTAGQALAAAADILREVAVRPEPQAHPHVRPEARARVPQDPRPGLQAEAGVPTPNVRLALHSAVARDAADWREARQRCVRLRSLAVGGQVLLTAETADLARRSLPRDLRLRPVGSAELGGLGQPQRVFRLVVSGLTDAARPQPSTAMRLLGLVGLCRRRLLRLWPTLGWMTGRLRSWWLRSGSSSPPLDAGVPPDRNPRFIGREPELKELRARFRSQRRVALIGPPGVGKTQLALEFLHRHRARYPNGIFWLRGDRQATLNRDLAALAGPLQLPQRGLRDQELILGAVIRWLRAESGWLLVVDNLENPSDLERLLPRALDGDVLITSRHLLDGTSQVVHPLSPELAARFLLLRTGQQDETAAAELAHELGGLPLALEQAAAYMTTTGESVAGYLAILRQRPADLLATGTPIDYPLTVVRTLCLSFQQVQHASRPAADLLCLCAFLAPDDIPISLLANGAPALEGPLRTAAADPLLLNEAISVLLGYSMLSRHGGHLSVHRLVQAVVREAVLGGRSARWAAAALRVLTAAFPDHPDDERRWPECARLLPHALATCSHPVTRGLPDAETLRGRVGAYLVARAAALGDVDQPPPTLLEPAATSRPTRPRLRRPSLPAQVRDHPRRAAGAAAAAAIVVLGVLGMTVPIGAAPTITEFPIPTTVSSHPVGITAGPDGNLWVAQSWSDQIAKLTLTGAVTEFRTADQSAPYSIVSGPDSNQWFTEPGIHKIGRISHNGTIANFDLPADADPHIITGGPDGNLWFTEHSANKIGRITTAGTVTEFPVPTTNSGPEAIVAGPDGNLWFTENTSSKVARINPDGKFNESNLPTPNSGPTGITIGPDGSLWVTETTANRLARVSPAGAITEYKVPTINSRPDGISEGADGNLWFTENASNKLARVNPAGAITEISLPGADTGPSDIIRGADNAVWFTEGRANRIGRIMPTRSITEFTLPAASTYPFGIAYANDGSLWFAESKANNIGRIYPDGAIKEFPIPTPGSTPIDIVTDAEGGLWFTEDGGSKIGHFRRAGRISEFSVSRGSGPSFITAGPEGNLWFTETIGSKVARLSPSGQLTEYPTPTADSYPGWIIVGPDHNMWFTEGRAEKVGRISRTGIVEEFPVPGAGGILFAITVGPDGELWFTEPGSRRIARMTMSGKITAEFPVLSGSIPWGLTAGPDGNVWFTASENVTTGKVGRITPSGTVSEFSLPSDSGRPIAITAGPDGALWFTEQVGNKIGRIYPSGRPLLGRLNTTMTS
jgi:streptogramin lyase